MLEKIVEEIRRIYDELIEYEIDGKKNSEEYDQLLKKLNELRKKEEKEYDLIANDEQILENAIECLHTANQKEHFHEGSIEKRVYTELMRRMNNKCEDLIQFDIIMQNIDYLTLRYMQDYEEDSELNILKSKYNLSFSRLHLEKRMILTKFNVPDEMILDYLYEMRKNGASEKDIDMYLINACSNTIMDCILSLTNIKNEDYEDTFKAFQATVIECALKASIDMIGEKCKTIGIGTTGNNSISVSRTKEIIENRAKEKRKVKIIEKIKFPNK